MTRIPLTDERLKEIQDMYDKMTDAERKQILDDYKEMTMLYDNKYCAIPISEEKELKEKAEKWDKYRYWVIRKDYDKYQKLEQEIKNLKEDLKILKEKP